MAESTLIFGDEQHLIATLTHPEAGSPAPTWVAVLTNSGVIPRMGPHRMNVRLARQFAKAGIPSIRFDLSGLGDSRRASGSRPVVEQWVEDTRMAMDVAQRQWGPVKFFMICFCSGAEVAHLTALSDSRLQAAVLWDFYSYPTPQAKVHQLIYRVRRAGVQGMVNKITKKMFGEDDAKRREPPPDDGLQGMTSGPVTPKNVYAQRFQKLVDQGVELFFYYSGGEPEWYAYRNQFFDIFQGHDFVQKVSFDQLAVSDHLITSKAAQEGFSLAVHDWLAKRIMAK